MLPTQRKHRLRINEMLHLRKMPLDEVHAFIPPLLDGQGRKQYPTILLRGSERMGSKRAP